MTDAILFDYGGTLDGAGLHWFDRFLEIYRTLGVTRSGEEIKAAFYAAEEELLRNRSARGFSLERTLALHVNLQLARLGLEDERLKREFVARFLASCRSGWRESRNVLSRLAPRFALGVVSNFYGNLRLVLEEAGLAAYFSVAIDSEQVGVRKPEPGIFETGLRALRAPAHQAIFVGDSLARDIVPAKELGMKTIWVRRSSESPAGADRADWRINSLEELLELPL